jgi:hypothetical protein
LLSQDAARFAMIPSLRATLGLKGHRPVVGNLDRHDLVYLFGALNIVTGQLTTRLVENPWASAKSPQNRSGQRSLQRGLRGTYGMSPERIPRPNIPAWSS